MYSVHAVPLSAQNTIVMNEVCDIAYFCNRHMAFPAFLSVLLKDFVDLIIQVSQILPALQPMFATLLLGSVWFYPSPVLYSLHISDNSVIHAQTSHRMWQNAL